MKKIKRRSRMSIFLEDFAAFAETNGYHIFRVTEIVPGKCETLELHPAPRCQNSYSVAKVFTVTALGLLWDRWLLRADDKITDILRRFLPKSLDPRWETVTVEDAILHKLGLPCGFLDIDVKNCPDYGADFLARIFEEPLATDPCHAYCYTDAAYYLLSRVVAELAGMPLDDFLREELFLPLQFAEAAWTRCPKGHAMGATGLYLHSADMAKLGEVYLRDGLYGEKRIISAEWVQTVLKKSYELSPIADTGAYGKRGMYGQMLLLSPRTERVVAFHGFSKKSIGDLNLFAARYK
jgi:CubicO group peptidase (beta-lactamase class C family)